MNAPYRVGPVIEPLYGGGCWTYPESWTARNVVGHALCFALYDYEAEGTTFGHPATQGPAAIRDALRALRALSALHP